MKQSRTTEAKDASLATFRPDLVAEWHPTRNSGLAPEDVRPFTGRKVWWLCARGHEWEAACSNRSRNNTGCPYCSGRLAIEGVTDLATTHPELAAEWHPTKNGDVTPSHVKAGSNKSHWWQAACGHSWQATPNSRSGSGYGCPYCAGRLAIEGVTDLATTHPALASEWHPTRNGDVTPAHVKAGTNKAYWWQAECGHVWQASPNRRTNMGTGCPYCANQAVLAGFNDLATTHPDVAAQWHPELNGDLGPHGVGGGSSSPAWWLGACGHEWESSIVSRSGLGRGCPYCANKAVLVGFNDLATTHPDVAAQWHPELNGDLGPTSVTAGSRRDVWWRCADDPGHEWRTKPHERTGPHGTGCPECFAGSWASKGEDEVSDFVESLGFVVRRGVRIDGERSTYDIAVDERRVLIEYHGVFFHTETPARPDGHHADKHRRAQDNGWTLLTVWEDDWKARPDVVKAFLAHKLGRSTLPRVAARATRVVNVSAGRARSFLDTYHIQGHGSGSVRLGLVHDDTLVAVLVARISGAEAEIVRYATSAVTPGGFGKLLRALLIRLAADHSSVERVKTFSDNAVSDGALYERLGFIRDADLPPDYSYAGNRTGWRRVHKFNFRLSRFRDDPDLVWFPGATEGELSASNGLEKVWDCGKVRWVLSVPGDARAHE